VYRGSAALSNNPRRHFMQRTVIRCPAEMHEMFSVWLRRQQRQKTPSPAHWSSNCGWAGGRWRGSAGVRASPVGATSNGSWSANLVHVRRDGRRFVWAIDPWSQKSQQEVVQSTKFGLAGSERTWSLSYTRAKLGFHLTCLGERALQSWCTYDKAFLTF